MIYDCLIHEKLLHTDEIKGAIVSLKLQGFYDGKKTNECPHYSFFIMLGNKRIGVCSLSLGYHEMTPIHGHIGYTIDEGYRGYGYSYYALQMILNLAREHGYERVLMTSDPKNLSSINSILKVGGKLIKEAFLVPKDHIYYVLGITYLNLYEITLA